MTGNPRVIGVLLGTDTENGASLPVPAKVSGPPAQPDDVLRVIRVLDVVLVRLVVSDLLSLVDVLPYRAPVKGLAVEVESLRLAR